MGDEPAGRDRDGAPAGERSPYAPPRPRATPATPLIDSDEETWANPQVRPLREGDVDRDTGRCRGTGEDADREQRRDDPER